MAGLQVGPQAGVVLGLHVVFPYGLVPDTPAHQVVLALIFTEELTAILVLDLMQEVFVGSEGRRRNRGDTGALQPERLLRYPVQEHRA